MFGLANPDRFLRFTRPLTPVLWLAAAVLLVVGTWFSFIAPEDYQQTAEERAQAAREDLAETKAARIWASWENALASVHSAGMFGESPADYARAFARLENHYFQNAGFLECDGWILREKARIKHIPATIIQGRYDMICPPVSAWKLAQGWDACEIRLIPFAGHALSEPGISEGLVRAMAIELAPHGVLVNGIAPGPFRTNIAGGRIQQPEVASQFAALEDPSLEPGVLRLDACRPLDQLLPEVVSWAQVAVPVNPMEV